MNIIVADRTLADAWDAYVATSPQASFYHRYGWRRVNDGTLDHRSFYLAALDGSRIVGVFPFVQVKSGLFGNLGCSMPFVNYGGPCADAPEIEQRLLDRAREITHELELKYLEIRSRRHLGDALPCGTHKVSVTLALPSDPDVLWKTFKTGHRQDIRRAYKYGFVARFGGMELLEPFYEVMSESWRNLGTPLYNRHYFRTLVEAFPGATRLCVVYHGDEPAAVAFDGIHGDTIEGMWMGAKAKYRQRLVSYVLYWELIKHAAESGATRFHFGRSTADSGSETFKKKWQASVTQLYWHYILPPGASMPALNVDNPRYRRAIDAWQRLPIGVTRFIGPSIARCIP
jgi:FemAB-related protein (PEP-CTERM system-associated)